jgi:DNA (cytosine-5)-methyltransferase 1
MTPQLVLSLFPGIGLLDMAFEEEGFVVVRGPDLLWGGDIRRFHPPAGKFDGVIGGPPCQAFSRLVNLVRAKGQTPKPNLIPEFERVVREASPTWFLMENVPDAPVPRPKTYDVVARIVRHDAVGGETTRERRFTFGAFRQYESLPTAAGGFHIEELALHLPDPERAVVATSSKEGALAKQTGGKGYAHYVERNGTRHSRLPGQTARRSIARCAELQGLPADFLQDAPFTAAGKYEVIGNGVPLQMGRAVARAVKRALGIEAEVA